MKTKPQTGQVEVLDEDARLARNPANRRRRIISALKRCMIEKGYAETNLTDLAGVSGMSVSHLLYYYSSKELVLIDLCEQVYSSILDDVTSHRDEPVEERVHSLVENMFVRNSVSRAEMGIVRELATLAIHRPELRTKLTVFAAQLTDYLQDLFAKAPRHAGLPAGDAAEIASALWIGLFTNVASSERLSDSSARGLFRKTLMSMANLEGAAPIADWSGRASAPGAVSGTKARARKGTAAKSPRPANAATGAKPPRGGK